MASFFRLFGKFVVLMISAMAGTCLQRLSGALQASPQVLGMRRFISERNRPKRSFSAEHPDRERRTDYFPIGLAESTLGVDLDKV
jgi:hypothetical protein